MIAQSIFILISWFGSIFFTFWIASMTKSDDFIDPRDEKSLRDASSSVFFLRG